MIRIRTLSHLVLLVSMLTTAHQQQACADEGDLINQFGNLVLPRIIIADVAGIPNRSDSSGTAGDPEDFIEFNDAADVFDKFNQLIEDVEGLPSSSNPVVQEGRDEVLAGLNDIRQVLLEKGAAAFEAGVIGAIQEAQGKAVLINSPGIGAVADALGGLPAAEFVTNDQVQAAITVVADADPYVSLGGSITNTSPTETLSVFIPFEEAFLNPIALDDVLLRQTFIEISVEDTNDDGTAFLQEGQIAFQVLATEDLAAPTFFNSDPLGTSEALGISRLTDTTDPRLRTRISTVREVNRSRIDRVDEAALISHMTGEFRLTELSPGDTATFTALVSLGIEGDPLTPLMPAESIASIYRASELLANNPVPEPTSGMMVAMGLVVLSRGRRSRLSGKMP